MISVITKVMPLSHKYANIFAGPIDAATVRFDIVGKLRHAAFLAQVAYESSELNHVKEIWGPTVWQLRYENNHGLGNINRGDGERFMGRGLIQITGRANYAACSHALFRDDRLLAFPNRLESPNCAALSAGWFWNVHGLNELADKEDFDEITKRINPAMLGYAQRLVYYEIALGALK